MSQDGDRIGKIRFSVCFCRSAGYSPIVTWLPRHRRQPPGVQTRFLWVWLLAASPAFAWDYELHRLVNELALRSLPESFPAFVRTPENAERIAFLAGEPDRWRNANDNSLRHVNEPDHFFDIEDLEPLGIRLGSLTGFREEFVARIAEVRAKDPVKFPSSDPAIDTARNRWLPGFLPWKLAEEYGRLKSGFSYLKTFEQNDGMPSEIVNAQANVVYFMGVMGHFAGDAAQPLHTTRYYNGWVGENPKGYTTNRTIHAWIDGGFARAAGIDRTNLFAKVRPARLLWQNSSTLQQEPAFPVTLAFVREQFVLVDTVYAFEKSGKLTAESPDADEGRRLIESQLLKAGQFLGDLWLSAWTLAPNDTYLQSALARRKLEEKKSGP